MCEKCVEQGIELGLKIGSETNAAIFQTFLDDVEKLNLPPVYEGRVMALIAEALHKITETDLKVVAINTSDSDNTVH